MVREPVTYGFEAEYPGEGAVYNEFENFLRTEFEKRSPAWDPSFGRVSRLEPEKHTWNYGFLLRGNVPEARTKADAEHGVRELVHELAVGLRLVHANPGGSLPEPVVRVWRW